MKIDPAPHAPSAQGTLAKRPLAHLLAYASEKKLSGSLVFGDVNAPAGAIVVAEGLLKKASFVGAPAAAGVWESLAELRDETPFAYFAGYDPLPAETAVHTSLLEAVFRVLRRRPPLAQLEAAFTRLGAAALVVDASLDFAGLALTAEGEAALTELRQRPFTIEAVRACSELRPRADILVYGLLITKLVQVVAKPTPSASAATPSSADLDPDASADGTVPEPPDSSEQGAAVGRVKLTRASQKLVPMQEERALVSSYDGRASIPPPPPPAATAPVPPPSSRRGTGAPVPASRRGTPAPASVSATKRSRTATKTGIGTMQTQTAAPAPPPPKVSSTQAIADRRQEIVDRAGMIDTQNYFEMLDIPEDLPTAQVQAAFIQLAKKWHPDRLPAELSDVREACARVFSRLSEATSTLCDEEQRKRYMRLLTEGGATPQDQDAIATVVEAATSFQKAEIMLKRGDLAKAEELCGLAVRLDSQPDYVAMLTWIESLKPANQSADATKRFEATLTAAIEKSERCERAVFYRAVLRKRLGNLAAAHEDFQRAFELNPRNLDAQREVRIYEMRQPATTDRKASFMGRLFKK